MSDNGSMLDYELADLADAEAPSALPEGDYPAEIIGTAMHVSASTGKPSVKVDFVIKPEDYPADYIDAASYPEGKTVSFYIGAGKDRPAQFRMAQFLKAIKAPTISPININDWLGLSGKLVLKADEYEGIQRERITRVESL